MTDIIEENGRCAGITARCGDELLEIRQSLRYLPAEESADGISIPPITPT